MSSKIPIFKDPKQFTKALQESSCVIFENEALKAEISTIVDGHNKRETKIQYYQPTSKGWQKFSFCISSFKHMIVEDFTYQCRIFGLLN